MLSANIHSTSEELELNRQLKESEQGGYTQKNSQIQEEISIVQSAYDLLSQHAQSQ